MVFREGYQTAGLYPGNMILYSLSLLDKNKIGGIRLMIDDSYLLADTISHIGQRRRERKKGYYVSGIPCKNHSGLNLIFNRPKRNRKCPICGAKLFLVSEVDEFEIARIKSWATGNLYIEGSHA